MLSTVDAPAMNGVHKKYEEVLITPDMAAAMLEAESATGIKNRPINRRAVARYAEEMKAGEWELQYDPIIVSKSGFVMDGQHRLHAIIASGTSQWFLIARDAEERLITKIGVGNKRTPGDVLDMLGYANSKDLAAILKLLHSYYRNGSVHIKSDKRPEPHEYETLAKKYPAAQQAASYARSHSRAACLKPSILGMMWYLFGQISQDDRNDFFGRLVSGLGLEDGSPILVLKNRLIEAMRARSSQSLQAHDGDAALVVITIKAWNAYRKDDTIKVLRYNRKETFPVPV